MSSRPKVAARTWLMMAMVALAPVIAGCTSAPEATEFEDAPLEHAKIQGIRHIDSSIPARDFTATTVDGEEITLSDLKGKVVLLEFMGAGCTSCLANLPHHKAVHAAYANNTNFAFIALDAWSSETTEDLRAYRDHHEINWPMAMAPQGAITAYEVRGTPTQFLIDHLGNFHSRGGYLSEEAMVEEIEYLLSELPAPSS